MHRYRRCTNSNKNKKNESFQNRPGWNNWSRIKFHFILIIFLKKIKKGHILDVGFDNLKIKIISVKSDKLLFRTLSPGRLENNKGVHLINGKINLDYLTKKDFTAIKLARKYKIKNFALSFANSSSDIKKFNKLLPRENKILKLKTLQL